MKATAVDVASRFTLATRYTFDFHVPDASHQRKLTPLPYSACPLPPDPVLRPSPPDPVDPASTPNDMTATTAEAALARRLCLRLGLGRCGLLSRGRGGLLLLRASRLKRDAHVSRQHNNTSGGTRRSVQN